MKISIVWAGAALAVVTAVCIGGFQMSKILERYDNHKQGLAGLVGAKFGQSQQQVLYAFGTPTMVQMTEGSLPNGKQSEVNFPSSGLPNKTVVEDYPIWKWLVRGRLITVEFDHSSKNVYRVSCSTFDQSVYGSSCITIGRVMTGVDHDLSSYYGSEAYIVDTLGKPDREVYDKPGDTQRKVIYYDKLGLQLILIREQLVSIHKWEAQPDFSWWLGHKSPSY